MQNREELGQEGHDKSKKMTCHGRQNISFFEGGGINIAFGPKYGTPVRTESASF